MPNCDKCIWSIRSGHCVLLECKFVSYEDARRIMEEKERKDEKTVSSMSMTLDEAIVYVETVARANESIVSNYESDKRRSKTYRQLAAYLRELQERRKQPEIIFCHECKHWKDSDGVYRRGINAESKCPVNSRQVYEGTFFCGMAEREHVEDS